MAVGMLKWCKIKKQNKDLIQIPQVKSYLGFVWLSGLLYFVLMC